MYNPENNNEVLTKEEYNELPVFYCKNCFSLKIMILDDTMDYCDECGCTDIGTTDIKSWKDLCNNKYGISK